MTYVASDYGGAVRGGQVVDQAELDEQLSLLKEAHQQVSSLPDGALLASMVAQATDIAQRHGEASELKARLATAQELLLTMSQDVVPARLPSAERGRAVFEQNCASCHGADGSGQTPVAAQLKPPPADLLDPPLVEGISPLQVALTVEFGIPGTAMVARPDLSLEDRWAVAFYVSSLTLTQAPLDGAVPSLSLEEATVLSTGQLRKLLTDAGVPAARIEPLITQRRTTDATDSALAQARSELRRARAFSSVDEARAQQHKTTAIQRWQASRSNPPPELEALLARLRSASGASLAAEVDAALPALLRLDTSTPKPPMGMLAVLAAGVAVLVAWWVVRRRTINRPGNRQNLGNEM